MRRRLMIGLGFLVIAVVLAVLFEPTGVIRGRLRGENFYRGRPTSYWRVKARDYHRPNSPDGSDPIARRPVPAVYDNDVDATAVPVLVDLLSDDNDQVCFVACNSLARIGPEASLAVPVLSDMLQRQDVYYRRNASKVLAAISPDCEEAIPVLIESLKEEEVWVNWHAAVALGKIGPAAKDAVPALLEVLRSQRARTSYHGPGETDRILHPGQDRDGDAAVFALERIDPDLGAKERARWSETVVR